MNDRIKLAEAMDYIPENQKEWCDPMWFTPYENDPKANEVGLVLFDHLPDPFTDANDCEALIEHLNKMGIFVNVVHGVFFDSVALVKNTNIISSTEGSDWKKGVCTLALKVIDDV